MTTKYDTGMFPIYMSLLYSCLHPMIGVYAMIVDSVFWMSIGVLLSCVYYTYAMYPLYCKRKYNGSLSSEDWLSIAHHVITLYSLSFYVSDLEIMNKLFTVTIASNIFLYIAYINHKKNIWFGKTRLNILTIETILYVFLRLGVGMSIFLSNYGDISTRLVYILWIVCAFSSWWSYKLIKKLKLEYALYAIESTKKKF